MRLVHVRSRCVRSRGQRLEDVQRKDRQELALNRAVCANRMLLTVAQERIKDPKTWR